MRRDDLEVVGEVEAGGAVEDAAVRLDQLDELELAKVGRALEHEVLEEMGESGAIAGFVTEADMVVDPDSDGRCGGVSGKDHAEAVPEPVELEGDLER
jgi:hypothetical protein